MTTKTPKEAAAYLGMKAQTLAVWRTTGRYCLPFVRVGRSIRYRVSDLDAWMASRTATSNAQAGRAAH